MISRTTKAITNATWTGISTLLTFPIQFINRYYMVHYLGITYLGITSLYSNILSILSLADLGVGTAITFLLYKPLQMKDWKSLSAIMNLYKKIYRWIAAVILVLGLIVIPFLGFFLKSSINYNNVYILYLVYLFGTVSSYLFSYNQSLLYADQNAHIVSIITLVTNYIMVIIQVVTLLMFKNPVLYALLFVFNQFIANCVISLYVKKKYSMILKTNKSISHEEKRQLRDNVVGNMFLRVGGVVVTGTDNLFLSAFTNVIQVGLYTNYLTITSSLQRFMTQMIGAITGSIGNFSVVKSKKEASVLFQKLQFINFIIVSIATLAIIFLSNEFISLWLGKKYVLDHFNVILIGLSFYFMNYRMIGWNFISVYALAPRMKLFAVNEMLANVIFSLIFLKAFNLGLTGVLLGTIFSTILTVGWQDPYVIFKHGFNTSPRPFFSRYILNLVILILELSIVELMANFFINKLFNSFSTFMVMIPIIIIIGIITPLPFYYKSLELQYSTKLIKRLLKMR